MSSAKECISTLRYAGSLLESLLKLRLSDSVDGGKLLLHRKPDCEWV